LKKTYASPALIPVSPSEEFQALKGPKLKKVKQKGQGLRIRWKAKGELPYYYVVYRFYGNQIGDFNNPKSIWHISPFYPEKKITLYDPDYR